MLSLKSISYKSFDNSTAQEGQVIESLVMIHRSSQNMLFSLCVMAEVASLAGARVRGTLLRPRLSQSALLPALANACYL